MELAAKCWDLASAYKQVPLSDAAFELGSYLVVFNPHLGKPEVYQQAAFLGCALAIWHIGSVLLAFTWTPYFDDFLIICDERAVRHVEVCNFLFFQLLGWKLSKDKLVPYETCCKVLRVELDLTRSPAGVASLYSYNSAARREELTGYIQHILLERKLTKSEAERFRGRLQFASNYLFGKRFRNCLKRSEHPHQSGRRCPV